jgi:hypothetical protein
MIAWPELLGALHNGSDQHTIVRGHGSSCRAAGNFASIWSRTFVRFRIGKPFLAGNPVGICRRLIERRRGHRGALRVRLGLISAFIETPNVNDISLFLRRERSLVLFQRVRIDSAHQASLTVILE